MYADVKVALGGLIVQAAVASIEDRSWQQDPLSGQWSEIDPEVMCAQVLEPFEVTIPIGSFETGSYGLVVGDDRYPFEV